MTSDLNISVQFPSLRLPATTSENLVRRREWPRRLDGRLVNHASDRRSVQFRLSFDLWRPSQFAKKRHDRLGHYLCPHARDPDRRAATRGIPKPVRARQRPFLEREDDPARLDSSADTENAGP